MKIASLLFAATVCTATALGASAQPPSSAAAPLTAPSPSQILDICMKREVPKMLQLLGVDPRIRTREDAAIAAHHKCQFIVAACVASPSSDDCQAALQAFGLGDPGYRPSPAAALYNAAERGDVNSIRRLLAEGAAPNWQNSGGWTPLMIAAAEKHLPAVVALLEAKGDPNIRNGYGRTALMFASAYGQAEIVARLLAAGADPNLVPTDQTGWTALISAAAHGHAATVEVLLRAGADPGVRTRDGRTATDMAREGGHVEVFRMLEAAVVPRA